jgi:hypothetical protein
MWDTAAVVGMAHPWKDGNRLKHRKKNCYEYGKNKVLDETEFISSHGVGI